MMNVDTLVVSTASVVATCAVEEPKHATDLCGRDNGLQAPDIVANCARAETVDKKLAPNRPEGMTRYGTALSSSSTCPITLSSLISTRIDGLKAVIRLPVFG